MSQQQPPRGVPGRPPQAPASRRHLRFPGPAAPASGRAAAAVRNGRRDRTVTSGPGKGLVFLGCGGAAGLVILIAALAASSPSSSAPPAGAQQAQAAPSPSPAASCKLKTTFDYLVRTTEPGLQPQAQEIGNVNLAACTDALADFAATAGQAPGECTTVARVADNPGYNPDAVPAPPLRHVLQSAGPGC